MPTPPFHTQEQAAPHTVLPLPNAVDTLRNPHPQTRHANSPFPIPTTGTGHAPTYPQETHHDTNPHHTHTHRSLSSVVDNTPPHDMTSPFLNTEVFHHHVSSTLPQDQASPHQPPKNHPDLYRAPPEKNRAERRSVVTERRSSLASGYMNRHKA